MREAAPSVFVYSEAHLVWVAFLQSFGSSRSKPGCEAFYFSEGIPTYHNPKTIPTRFSLFLFFLLLVFFYCKFQKLCV